MNIYFIRTKTSKAFFKITLHYSMIFLKLSNSSLGDVISSNALQKFYLYSKTERKNALKHYKRSFKFHKKPSSRS